MKKRVTAISIVSVAIILIVFMLLAQKPKTIKIHFVQAPLQKNAFYTYQEAYQQIHDQQMITKVSFSKPVTALLPQSLIQHVVADNIKSMQLIHLALSQPYVESPVTSPDQNMPYLMEWRELISLLQIEQDYYKQQHNHFSAAKLGLDAELFSVQIPHNGPLITDLVSVASIPNSCRSVAAELPYLNKQQLNYCISRQNEIISLHVPFYKILETERDTQISQLESDIRKKDFTTVINDNGVLNFHPDLTNAAFDMRYLMTSGGNVVQDEWDTLNYEIAICRPGTSPKVIHSDKLRLKQLAAFDPVNSMEENLLKGVKNRHDLGRKYLTSLMSTMQTELAVKSKLHSPASQ